MLYLLDANVLIRASADYYPPDRVPEFWSWLLHHGDAGRVKIPFEIMEEVEAGGNREGDLLLEFIRSADCRRAMRLDEEVRPELVAEVLDRGYAPDLTDIEVETIGRDPFLVAYAAVDVQSRTVVTAERSAISKQRAKRKLPDVCAVSGVRCVDPFAFYRELKFSTAWRP